VLRTAAQSVAQFAKQSQLGHCGLASADCGLGIGRRRDAPPRGEFCKTKPITLYMVRRDQRPSTYWGWGRQTKDKANPAIGGWGSPIGDLEATEPMRHSRYASTVWTKCKTKPISAFLGCECGSAMKNKANLWVAEASGTRGLALEMVGRRAAGRGTTASILTIPSHRLAGARRRPRQGKPEALCLCQATGKSSILL
jgi:hypothetical protein